ncbi:secretory glycoprotein k5 precursor [Schistosoma japonicum]|nr:secretory glycoprotein k5 precursor [Schistosoma japonicum]
MAEKPEINLTLYESAKTIRATEKEFQVKWALDYLNGCTVLNKYTEWKWKNRTELDLLAIKQLNDLDLETGSKYHKNRDNAWDKCLLAVKANLEYEQVKGTNSSSMKKKILKKKERNLKKALENLITQVKFFNTQMFNYFKFLKPIERVNTVVELMESEVEYNIGRSSYRENNCRSMSVQL